MRMNWYIETDGYVKTYEKRAGAKAPSDIAEIYWLSGMKALIFPVFSAKAEVYKKFWLLTVGMFSWFKVFCRVHNGDVIFFRHPFYGKYLTYKWIPLIQRWKRCKFIVMIHDLESLRKKNNSNEEKTKSAGLFADKCLLKQFDAIICHNSVMKEYLISLGYCADKIICLEIFDYLTKANVKHRKQSEIPSIAIAGNLDMKKSGYIYKLDFPEDVLTIHLYGVNFEASRASSNLNYHGSFEAEELSEYLSGDFGLVWDGISTETCTGNTGEYLRYNNPHKLSLYLASNMPVIVWEESATADFVISRNVGFTVKSLNEIPEKIRTLSSVDYQMMCDAAQREGKKLRSGYYTKRAIDQALRVI